MITDVTFRIMMLMMLYHGWDSEIVDPEKVFLYGNLEEEIYMKIPSGFAEYSGSEKKMSV